MQDIIQDLLLFLHNNRYLSKIIQVFNNNKNVKNVIKGVFSTIASFRAYWYLLDEYFLTQDLHTSQLIALVLGLGVLCSLRVVTCLHAGVQSDDPG